MAERFPLRLSASTRPDEDSRSLAFGDVQLLSKLPKIRHCRLKCDTSLYVELCGTREERVIVLEVAIVQID